MKRGTLATVFSLVGLLAAPAGAQTMVPPDGYDPNGYEPEGADPGGYDPNQAYPDLGPDDEIAQSYDDGYDPQAYEQFQDALTPYGSWTDDDTYGQVWTPAASIVGNEFMPYASSGHWVLSEYGWTWVSDWNWGWAPFHYGRWIVRAGHWCWVPGTMWGPAWVSWRSGGGYVGWAPLPPRGVRLVTWTGVGSPWRFTTAATLGAPRPTFVAPRHLPALFARTTVVSTDRLLTRDNWRVHVNAGPIRGVNAPIVALSRVAPKVLPRVAVYPRAGMPVYSRPWVRRPEARRDPLTNGWRAGMPAPAPHATGLSTHATVTRPAPFNGGMGFAPRAVPSTGTPVYGRPAPSFAGHPSAGASMQPAAPRPGFQPPPAPGPALPMSRPAFQPPGVYNPAPAPRTFTPPPANTGGFHPQPMGGFRPQPQPQVTAGGSHPQPPPRAFVPPPANTGFQPRPAPPAAGGFGHFGGTPAPAFTHGGGGGPRPGGFAGHHR